jgi:hypothetical protein
LQLIEFINTDIPEFNLTFNGTTIPITNSHKHLGVTFSSDAKWNIHIENILLSIYKHRIAEGSVICEKSAKRD